MTRRMLRIVILGAGLGSLTACATGRALHSADAAAKRGDWDSAVAYYREAFNRDINRLDIKVALQNAMNEASNAHLKRAHDLEAQDQLAGAAAEYRQAADLELNNAYALSKAVEIEQKIREQVEASRPKPQIDQLRAQAQQTSPVPQLYDPRVPVKLFNYSGGVKDMLTAIGGLTGINVSFDTLVQNSPYTINVTDMPLEDVLSQILTANTLTYKVTGPKAIFVYKDDQAGHTKYEDQYIKTFYPSNADPNELVQLLTQFTTTGVMVRPTILADKYSNAIIVRATDPVMKVVEQVIAANDVPRAEVEVDVEILEVNRTRAKQIGLDLSQYALGFTFSPEVTPPNTSTTIGTNAFPTPANPFNLNTVTQGLATNNFYVSAPSALIHLLESDEKTRLLAKPQLVGREGVALSVNLGSQFPTVTTTFQAAGAGGVANIPAASVTYQSIGVNLSMTPKVTYQDEIQLDNLVVDNSAVGPDANVGGQSFPTFIDRKATVSLLLRDGESNLLAGLVSESDKHTYTTLPGISQIPGLRQILGNENSEVDQTEIVMVVTPHIVRSHEMTAANLGQIYIGTGTNFGAGSAPPLIAPGTPMPSIPAPPAGTTTQPGVPNTTTTAQPPAATNTPPATTTPPPSSRVVPIQAVPSNEAPAPVGEAQVAVTAPMNMQAGGPPYAVPVSIANATGVGTATLTVTYNPAMLKATVVNQGSFMQQGGVTTTFAPKIDTATGRIDIPISRPAGASGASGPGILANIMFEAIGAGSSQITINGVLLTPDGKAIPVQVLPATVTIK